MTHYDLEQILLEELGYANSPGFEQIDIQNDTRSIPDVYSMYRVQNIPIAYFSRLSDTNPTQLFKLYKRVWNQSKVPLLYIILPQEIIIYNGYAEPPETPQELNDGHRLLQHLEQLTNVEVARQQIRRQLSDYDRLNLETGAFWDTNDGQRIHRDSRADQRLLRAMDQVRRHLLATNLSNDLAYTLLGRSIFIRYLEDRGILNSDLISQLAGRDVETYLDSLNDLDTTYRLFNRLSNRFNGDLFPVDSEKERKLITQDHLNILSRFLNGDDLDTGQQSFWPYDFRYIPIELISGIYDTFLSTNQRKKLGAFYTPLPLVDFILEETLSFETLQPETTLLDPACGSGIFLVRAYQRLVNSWQQIHHTTPNATQLSQILQHSIFGIDIKPEAVRIAAFSLYLAMLDYLDNDQILETAFQFPKLKEKNLFVSDFFSADVQNMLQNRKFDRVVGNPPWGKNTLTKKAANWLAENEYTVGGKQIAPAFMLRSPEFCTDNGEVALLAPAKSTILVTSDRNEKFRETFFNKFDVKLIFNFSALCYELFEDSLSPSIAIFFNPEPPTQKNQIVYGVPKPSPLSQRLGAIVLDTTEVKFLDRDELLAFPVLWKVALWGTPRDAAFIERLNTFPTLQEQAESLDWKLSEGIQISGGDDNPAPWLEGMSLLPTKQFRPYLLDMEVCKPIEDTTFHRPHTEDIVQAPLVLIRQSPVNRRCVASYSSKDVAYLDILSGVLGNWEHVNQLKWLVSFINSPLAQYYHFLTSSRWAVERGNILHKEYKRMPFYIPDEDDPQFKQVLHHFDQIVNLLKKRNALNRTEYKTEIEFHEAEIANLVFELYDLTPSERQLVQDTIDYTIDFFYWGKRKKRKHRGTNAVRPPDTKMLQAYAETFAETANALLRYQDQILNAVVYHNGVPLSIVGFEKTNIKNEHEIQIISNRDDLRNILRKLDNKLLEQRNSTLYMRRHVRIYDGAWLYLVRPSERRFWTRSQALTDVDDAIAEWLSSPSIVGVSQ